MSHDDVHEWSAAYVLGALNAADREVFQDHLEGCALCARQVLEFSPLPGLLALVDEADVMSPPIDVVEPVLARAAAETTRLRRSRRRWQALAAVAAAAALVVGSVAVLGADSDQGQNPAAGRPAEAMALASAYDVTGSITLVSQPWGTLVSLDLFDVPHRERYSMWTVGADGAWAEVGSWAWSTDGTCRVPGSTSLSPDQIDRVVVTSAGDRSDELAAGT